MLVLCCPTGLCDFYVKLLNHIRLDLYTVLLDQETSLHVIVQAPEACLCVEHHSWPSFLKVGPRPGDTLSAIFEKVPLADLGLCSVV